MATMSKAGHEPVQSEFSLTYGTGGIKSPVSLQVLSLHKFQQLLLTEYQAETEALHEMWEPFTSFTRQIRLLQHQKIEATFPFMVAGVIYNEEADLADEEEEGFGWQQLSGLIVLQFDYNVAKANAEQTASNRLKLQSQLLAAPLLGLSIVHMCKVPSECLINVLIAVGPMSSYSRRVCTITAYLQAACPELHRRLYGADQIAKTLFSIGFDPLAYLRPRPVDGYATFPVKQAKAAIGKARDKRR